MVMRYHSVVHLASGGMSLQSSAGLHVAGKASKTHVAAIGQESICSWISVKETVTRGRNGVHVPECRFNFPMIRLHVGSKRTDHTYM